jgi:CheY-like chemotaxis protein
MNREKILIVDDVAQNISILDNLLNFKYEILASTEGLTAFEIAKTELPDLILLDIVMPKLDGLTLCSMLKEHTLTKNIPIIFITAKNDDESIITGFKKGAVDYVTKPFKTDELLVRVSNHLRLVGYQKHLEKKVEREVSLRHEQEELLIQNSKMAEMGDMINNIAHQWRQPTSRVTLLLSNILMSLEEDNINKPYLKNKIDSAIEQMEFISSTIDDFSNFFSPKKKTKNFYVSQAIEKTLKIIQSTFVSFGIEIIMNDDDFLLNGNENELSQVVLIILSNAKDQFSKKQAEEKTIKIIINSSNKSVEFLDNAGGIRNDIVNKIFDHYFSTKNKDYCTGIGLYTAKMIIQQTFNGKIKAQNKHHGASFILEFLPSSSE